MKRTITIAMMMIMLMAPVAMGATVTAGNQQIQLPAGAEVVTDGDKTLIPVIPVLEAMGYDIEYHDDCGYLVAVKGNTTAIWAVGSKGYVLNGKVWRAFSQMEIRQGVLLADRLDLQWMLSDGHKHVPVGVIED